MNVTFTKLDYSKRLLILAHGAGQPADSPFMNSMSEQLGVNGIGVVRFNFPYMEKALELGRHRPPDNAEVLMACFRSVIADTGDGKDGDKALFIGGKSMGGRMATMIADESGVAGVVVLGYPFHPPGKPDKLRTAHLETMKTPALICQGERDPFGNRDEVGGYALSGAISFHWVQDGDHSFKPRKKSGFTLEENIATCAENAARFMKAAGR